MATELNIAVARRSFLIGAAATGVLALPGCTTMGGYGFSFVDAVRRLLEYSSRNAFARLTAPGGFWDSQVARFDLPAVFGRRGGVLQNILTSGLFRERLQRRLNEFAEDGAHRAAPLVADTIRTIGFENAVDLVRGGPTAATSYLRGAMGRALIDAMVPALGDAMRVAGDPLVSQAINALAGIDTMQLARAIADSADNAIWSQIGAEEAATRSLHRMRGWSRYLLPPSDGSRVTSITLCSASLSLRRTSAESEIRSASRASSGPPPAQ